MRDGNRFASTASTVVVGAALLLFAPPASALTPLRWMQPPGSSPAAQFQVYMGVSPDVGVLVWTGMPASDADGI